MIDVMQLDRNQEAHDNSSNLDLQERYRKIILKTVELVNLAGYELPAFPNERKSRFPEIPEDIQHHIVAGLESFYALCVSAAENGAELKGSCQTAAWWAIRSLKWRPFSYVFDQIQADDSIEIYDRNHVQIFRSFNMFRCLSYSLDELVTYEWYELYSRTPGMAEKVMATFNQVINEQITVVETSGESHIVSERFSPRRRSAVYETRLVSPLFTSNGQVGGYINVIRATPIEASPELGHP